MASFPFRTVGSGEPARAWAHLDGLLATDLIDVADLAERPDALDGGGWWAVVATFEGLVRAYRFATVRPAPLPRPARPWAGPDPGSWSTSLDRAGYIAAVGRVRDHIAAGQVYQVNVCRMLTAPLPAELPTADPSSAAPLDGRPTPEGLAQILAAGNPAPYQGVIHTGAEWIVSASPELYLRREGALVTSAPIKGTAVLGEDFQPKDYPENVMITDLVRNDLNRVCTPDSVRVRTLLDAEPHPGLVHLVSTVEGRLRPGVGWSELLGATFPPGSVTGAPKIRALEVIAELEPGPRGPYCGGIGFVDADASRAVLAVGIRTFFTRTGSAGDRELCFGTGAGITYPSDPADEWDETELKAGRLIRLASGRPTPARTAGSPLAPML
ncbi:anthranilate synthase component I family protein [Nakamurella silvestris]|nr:anthranilate synthase component I family protein [Nakamurella silvestris]